MPGFHGLQGLGWNFILRLRSERQSSVQEMETYFLKVEQAACGSGGFLVPRGMPGGACGHDRNPAKEQEMGDR